MLLLANKRAIVLNKLNSDYYGDMRMLAMIIKSLWYDEGGEMICNEFEEGYVMILKDCKKQKWAQIENEIRAWEELKTKVYRYNKRKRRT